MESYMAAITNGILEILDCGRRIMSLIVITISTASLFTRHMDGGTFAAVVATITAFYQTAHVVEAIKNGQN